MTGAGAMNVPDDDSCAGAYGYGLFGIFLCRCVEARDDGLRWQGRWYRWDDIRLLRREAPTDAEQTANQLLFHGHRAPAAFCIEFNDGKRLRIGGRHLMRRGAKFGMVGEESKAFWDLVAFIEKRRDRAVRESGPSSVGS